ncbi:MAG: prephenate dehydratase [Piccolia ochrophora]|nr:MAG: prephenate dehydratase [Piccolia ochrophora]
MTSDKPSVAYLGPPCSFSHQAALQTFPPSEYTLVPQPSIYAVTHSVSTAHTSHGIVPLSNSTNGPVSLTHTALAAHPNIHVQRTTSLKIHHCLIGHAPPPSASPHTSTTNTDYSLSHITRLLTHPQVWTQCTAFLAAPPEESGLAKGVQRVDAASTSAAVEAVRRDGSGRSAAIAAKVAVDGEGEGLVVLREGLEDDGEGNETRFGVVGLRRVEEEEEEEEKEERE